MTKEELRAEVETLYPINENDPQFIQNIREYKQDAYTRGYNAAKKELGWHLYPNEKPEKSGMCLVRKRHKHFFEVCQKYWNGSSFGMGEEKIEAYMSIPES